MPKNRYMTWCKKFYVKPLPFSWLSNFLVLINAWYSKKLVTGGEHHMLYVLKNWSHQHKISLFLPKLAYQATKELLPRVDLFYFTSNEDDDEIKSLIKLSLTYFVRIVRSIFIRPKDYPDIIITASHFLYDLLPAVILRRRYKSKLVVYCHGILSQYRSYNQGLRSNLMLLNEKISLYLCKRSADAIFAINNEAKEFLVLQGFDSNKITITRNGIDHEFISSINRNIEEYDASFCGRLVKRKGVYDLLEIWEVLLKYLPLSRLVIIGQGEEFNGLKEAIRTKSLDKNVVLTGYVSEAEKIGLFKSSKIFIFPSFEEAWGIAITEAMACGLPVACYDLPAYKFLKKGIIKLHIGNKELMTSSIINLLSDDIRRTKMSEEALQESKKFDWNNISNEELTLVSMLSDKTNFTP
jgi:glycosyltransferase involved in cell wall biosynthesis